MTKRTITPQAAALIEDATWIARWGGGLSEAATRLGYTRDSLDRVLSHYGQPALIDQLKRQDWTDLAKVDPIGYTRRESAATARRRNARKRAARAAAQNLKEGAA